jgi:transposase
MEMNAYSEDLREKNIEALRRGMGKSEAAHTFSVSLSSVKLAEEGRSPPRRDPARSRSSTSAPASYSKWISKSVLSSPSKRGASICGR